MSVATRLASRLQSPRSLYGSASLALRAAALFSRFLLLFYLARHFTVAEVGIYGLIVAALDFAVYLMGLEFATFGTRELIHQPRDQWPRILRDQAMLHLLAFLPALLIIPVLGRFHFFGGFAYWLLVLLLVEHTSQEAYRMMIAASKPLLAILMHFIRFGAWVYPALAVMWALPAAARLETVWVAWIGGACASLAVPALAFRDLDWGSLRGRPVDWRWLRRGMGVALVLFASALFPRAAGSLDRVILKVARGAAEVGIYHFFSAIVSVLPFLIEAGVQIHHGPKLVWLHRAGSEAEFRRALGTYAKSLGATTFAAALGLAAIIWPLLGLLGHSVYQRQVSIFWWLLAALVLLCLSFVPQSVLYARERDRAILLGNGVHFAVFVAAAAMLAGPYGALGIAMAQVAGALAGLAAKSLLALQRNQLPKCSTP